MNANPVMPAPSGEMTPQEVCDKIKEWAEGQGLEYEFRSASSEYGVVVVRDPAGRFTTTTVPNPHRGRRLRQDQVRYTIRALNRSWRS